MDFQKHHLKCVSENLIGAQMKLEVKRASAETLTPRFHRARLRRVKAAMRSAKQILAVLVNACVSTVCSGARFSSVPALRSAPQRRRQQRRARCGIKARTGHEMLFLQ